MCMCEQWWLHCTSQWGRYTLLSEHVYCANDTFKMIEQEEQWICIKFCIKLEYSSVESIQIIQKALGDNAMSTVQISVAQMLQRWSKICWKWTMIWKACNKQNTWKCWIHMGCIHKDQWPTLWELEADLRIPKLLCLRFWRRILAWNVLWQNSFHGFCYGWTSCKSRMNIL